MYRVLIVDDEGLVLDGLERILNKIPDITIVGRLRDGKQAVDYLERLPVDVVVTDIRMPIMDGLELTRWMSVHKPDCNVVLISAYNEFKYAQRAMEYGVRYYLLKPIRLAEVKKVMEQLMEKKWQRERKLLWNHDYKREIQELEMYHALINLSNPSEKKLKKKLYYAEYHVLLDRSVYEKMNLSEDMLRTGLTNIIRWCAVFCISVLDKQSAGELRYILLAESIDQFPQECEVQARIQVLMEIDANVRRVICADAKELIERNQKDLAQDAITDEIIVKAKQFIVQNLSKNISRDDVAAAVHLESAYFSKYFKKKSGMNFHDYLQQERISKVITLLECGYKVQDAASQAGYHNRNYFNQIFKQYLGCSPSEYKKKQLTDDKEAGIR